MYRKVEHMPHTLRPGLVDNSLSPHGGRLIERVATPQEIRERWPNGFDALPSLAVRDQIAQECVNIAYGFFSVVYLYPAGNSVANKSGTIPPFHHLCEGALPWYHTSFSTS
jgi:hypothetical protein